MVSTRRKTYGVEKKQPPPRQVQKKLRDKLDVAGREIEKAYDRVDQLESERLEAGDENLSFQSQIASVKTELESVRRQRDDLQQCIQQSCTEADRKALVWRGAAHSLKEGYDAALRREADKVKLLEEQMTTLMQQLRAVEENATRRPAAQAAPLSADAMAEIKRTALETAMAGGDLDAAMEAFFI